MGHDRLADRQSKTDALLVDALILLFQLAEALEELIKVAAFDTSASVEDVHDEILGGFVVSNAHLDEALLCEF